MSECLDFTPKHYICSSERDALELFCAHWGGNSSENYDNFDILHKWERQTFCKENYKAHGLYVPMKADMPLIKNAVYQKCRGCSIKGGIEIDTDTPDNNTNSVMNDYT